MTEIYKQVESLDPQYDFLFADAFAEHVDKDKKNSKDNTLLRYEYDLFRLMTINKYEQKSKSRFEPSITYTNGDVWPDKSSFTQEQLDYYRQRAEVTTNSVMKARYIDIVYELDKKSRSPEFAEKLVDAYLDAHSSTSSLTGIKQIDQLARALTVSKAWVKQKPQLLEKSKQAIVAELDRYMASEPRWALDLLEIIADEPKVFEDQDKQHFVQLAQQGMEHYKKNPNISIRESYTKVANKLSKVFNIKYDPRLAARELAQTYIDEALAREDSKLVQQHFYKEALAVFKKAGLKTEADQMIKKIEDIGKSDDFDKEFQEFSFEVPIEKKIFDDLKTRILDSDDKAAPLGIAGDFVPSWNKSVELGEKEPASFTAIFSQTHIDKDGIPIQKKSDEKTRQAMIYYESDFSFRQLLIDQTYGSLIDEGKISKADFENQFKKIKLIDEDTWRSVDKGLDLFFMGEDFAAISILVPQFESMLYGMSRVLLGSTQHVSRDSSSINSKILNGVLDGLEQTFGNDMVFDLKYLFTDPTGINLRNLIAHGGLKAVHKNRPHALLVIQAYLRVLVRLRPTEQQKGSDKA